MLVVDPGVNKYRLHISMMLVVDPGVNNISGKTTQLVVKMYFMCYRLTGERNKKLDV